LVSVPDNFSVFILGTGEDMELNGAVPDHVVWPDPADFARGVDAQLMKGVQILLNAVVEAEQKPQPKLHKATERDDSHKPAP
jgi:tricorn protease